MISLEDRIVAALSARSYRALTEAEMQEGIARVLDEARIAYRREARLAGGRVDFLIAGVALEVKTRGSRASVLRQLARYAGGGDVAAIVLATTLRRHDIPSTLRGVPVRRALLPLWGWP